MFSARPCSKYSASACSTLATPAICDAAFAASPALWPAMSTCTSPPHWPAAVTVLRVAPLIDVLSCSAMTSAVISDHLRFVLEFGDERRDVGHLHAGAALGRLGDLQDFQVRLDIHAKVGRLERVELPLLGLHDVGQRDVTRLIEAQVRRDDCRQGQRHGLQAAVD